MRRAVSGLLVVLAAVCGAAPSSAHDAPYSYLTLRAEPSRVLGMLTAHGFDLAHELGGPPEAPAPGGDTLLTPEAAARQGTRLWSILSPRLVLRADGRLLSPRLTGVTPDPERRGLTFEFEAPLEAFP